MVFSVLFLLISLKLHNQQYYSLLFIIFVALKKKLVHHHILYIFGAKKRLRDVSEKAFDDLAVSMQTLKLTKLPQE